MRWGIKEAVVDTFLERSKDGKNFSRSRDLVGVTFCEIWITFNDFLNKLDLSSV